MTLLDTKEGREALRWALNLWASVDRGQLPFTMGGRVSPFDARNHAFAITNDPAKLAEFMASEGRRLGLDAVVCEPFVIGNDEQWPMIAIEDIPGLPRFVTADSPRARRILAAWLPLPNGAREQAERILRGEP